MSGTGCVTNSSGCCSGESSDHPSSLSCKVLTAPCCPRGDESKTEIRSIQYNMIHEHANGPDVWKYYDNVALIGEGSISNIYKVRKHVKKNMMDLILCRGICSTQDAITNSKKRSQYYGLKEIDTKLVNNIFLEEMKNEIEMFRSMDHPNILRAYEVFHLKNHISIIMELCTGGDLYTRNPYTEREAGVIMKQLLSAVSYMHQKKIIHRDLKFENVMFSSNEPNALVKVIDFGLSIKYLDSNVAITDYVGTVYTMAPEVISKIPYSYKADVFSLGVISYMLLSGCKPFWAKTRKEVAEKVKGCKYSLSSRHWFGISEDAKDFVTKLLQKDPNYRLSAHEAKKHKWLQNVSNGMIQGKRDVRSEKIEDSLINYTDTSEFKRMVLNILAHQISTEDIKNLGDIFKSYDKGDDGYITKDELKDGLSSLSNLSDDAKEKIFHSLDFNKNGNVMYTEFIAATLESQLAVQEHDIKEAFDRIDIDRKGFISKKNLCCILGDACNDALADTILREADTNKDGLISFDEFITAFRSHKNHQLIASI